MAVVVQAESWWKRNLFPLIIILLFLFIMFKPSGCGPSMPWERAGRDTLRIETRTEQVLQPVVIGQSSPQQSGNTVFPITIPPQYNASQDIARLTEQYNELVKQFLATKTYKDSIVLKDTAGTRVGVVNLQDVVSENELKSPRNYNYQLSLPHTYTTITVQEPYKPKSQVFVGLGLSGNIAFPVNGAYGTLLLKNKKDRLFQIGAGGQIYNNQLVPQFSLGTSWKLGGK